MPNKLYDFAILGNEPVGLWLLKKLAKAGLKCVWLKLSYQSNPIFLPSEVLKNFDLASEEKLEFQFFYNGKILNWNKVEIQRLFPETEPLFKNHLSNWSALSEKAVEAIKRVIKIHPEILNFSRALWQDFSYSKKADLNAQVFYSLLYSDVSAWNIETNPIAKNADTQHIESAEILEVTNFKKEGFAFNFSKDIKIHTKNLIVNTPYAFALDFFKKSPAIFELLSKMTETHVKTAPLYSIPMFKSGAMRQQAVPTYSFFLINYPFSDPSYDLFSIHNEPSKNATTLLLGHKRTDIALEFLKTIEPFANLSIRAASSPAMTQLRYDTTFLNSNTSIPTLFNFTSTLQSHLPYPLGHFIEATRLFNRFNKPKKSQPNQDRLPINILSGKSKNTKCLTMI